MIATDYDRNHSYQKFYDLRGEISLCGETDRTARWIETAQLSDAGLWAKFVNEFAVRQDARNGGWRGEFWGKMMRGAVTVYQYTNSPALYKILEKTVRDMLKTQDGDGRISTYPPDDELRDWDVWCRKYVMLGMEFFLEICADPRLEKRIIRSLCGQADYLCSKLGDGEGKTPVISTSRIWGGMNSASVLEPMVRLYRLTGKRKYLALSRHIVRSGACAAADIFRLAYEDRLAPYQYGVSKAYEMMSCFEGLLEYHFATGNRKARLTVERFAKKVMKTDVTVIGSAGCTHELFDNSFNRQTTNDNSTVMQETCVTVTWMKLCSKLFKLTGDFSYADAVEKSFYNSYLGSLNLGRKTDRRSAADIAEGKAVDTFLPFDSYSFLTGGTRGKQAGGYQILADRSFYGCCACIASAGAGIYCASQILSCDCGAVINGYEDGLAFVQTPSGQRAVIEIKGGYPYGNGSSEILLTLEKPETFTLYFRSPQASRKTKIIIDGQVLRSEKGGFRITREWKNGDTVSVVFDVSLRVIKAPVYGKTEICIIDWSTLKTHFEDRFQTEEEKNLVCLARGPLTLALEKRLSGRTDLPAEPRTCSRLAGKPADGYRFTTKIHTRKGAVAACDFASAGSTWDERTEYAVWLSTQPAE